MSDEHRRELEERLVHLHVVLDFYATLGEEFKFMTPSQVRAHIDAILDEITEIKNELNDEHRKNETSDS